MGGVTILTNFFCRPTKKYWGFSGMSVIFTAADFKFLRFLDRSFCQVYRQGSLCAYRSSKWHYRQRKIIFELIMHFIADTDTDKYYFGINFS